MKYKGWIPVASGFLSFTNIRGQVIAGRCSTAPSMTGSLDKVGEICVIKSKRTLIDRPLESLRSAIRRRDESYSFECRAAREEIKGEEHLVGVVIAHPSAKANEAERVKAVCDIKPGVYERSSCWVIAFKLARNGCIELDWGSLRPGEISKIVDIQPGEEQTAEKLLTFESFSYLKDLIHNHKFHSIDDDSIVVPVKVDAPHDNCWMDTTARSLHRAIISSVRSGSTYHDLSNALGKTAYLRTFLSLSPSNFCKEMLQSLGNLETTIEIRLNRQEAESNIRDTVKNTWTTIVLACVATAMTLFQLIQIPCIEGLSKDDSCDVTFKVSKEVISSTYILLDNWSVFFVGTFALLCLIGYGTSRRAILDLYSLRTGNEKWDWHVMRFLYGFALTNGTYMALLWLTILFGVIAGLIGVAVYGLIS